MMPSHQEDRLRDLVFTHSQWTIDAQADHYAAWSLKYREKHVFTKDDLDAVDPRIHRVLTYEKLGSPEFEQRHVDAILQASADVWLHPERKIVLNGETVYWQSMTSIEAYDDGVVEVMFEAPKYVHILDDGTLIASTGLSQPNAEMPWSFWEAHFPGIEKYYNVAHTMGMDLDPYDAANYCEGMLYDRENMGSNVDVELPTDLVQENDPGLS